MQKNWGRAMLHINVQQQLGRLTLRADLQLPTQGVTAILVCQALGKTSLINLVSGFNSSRSRIYSFK